jgi:hypothetical protein
MKNRNQRSEIVIKVKSLARPYITYKNVPIFFVCLVSTISTLQWQLIDWVARSVHSWKIGGQLYTVYYSSFILVVRYTCKVMLVTKTKNSSGSKYKYCRRLYFFTRNLVTKVIILFGSTHDVMILQQWNPLLIIINLKRKLCSKYKMRLVCVTVDCPFSEVT